MYIYRFCWTCGKKRDGERKIKVVSMIPKYCKWVDAKKLQYKYVGDTLCNDCLHPWVYLMPSS